MFDRRPAGGRGRSLWVVVLMVTLSMAFSFLAIPSGAAAAGTAAPASPSAVASAPPPPASGTVTMNPTFFANGAVPTSAVFGGGGFGSGATIAFCLSLTPVFSSSTSIGSYTLAAGATMLSNAVVTLRSSQPAGAYVVAATDGTCGGGSSTYTSPIDVTLVASPYPSFSLANTTLAVGANVPVSGSGWDAGATVTLYLGYPGGSPALPSFTTTSAGALPSGAAFTVPSGLPQGIYGVFAEETHGPAGGGGVWVGFSAPYSGSTNFFSVGPSITVTPFIYSGVTGSSLTVTGTGFLASSLVPANSIVIAGIGTTHGAVGVSTGGTFSVSLTTASAIAAPGGGKTVVVVTSPGSSISSFSNAVWVSSPNPGALGLVFDGSATGPVSVTPTASVSAQAWNFPASASIAFWVGPTLVGTVTSSSLGFAQLPASATLPGMAAGSYRAVAVDGAAGLYSNPVSVTVNVVSWVQDPGGFVLPTSGNTEYLPSGGSVTGFFYGLAPGSTRTITDTVFAPLVSASLLASTSVGLAEQGGFATLSVSVGSFVAASGAFLPAANGTLVVTYAPLYFSYPLYGVPVPATGSAETISLCNSCTTVGTYRSIGIPSIGPADWTGYLAGATTAVTISNLIPSGSLLYSGSPAVSSYYNVYVGSSILMGTAGSTSCLASSPSTCYGTAGTLTIVFLMPAATGVQELAIVYAGMPASSGFAANPIVVSSPGATAGSGTLQSAVDPLTGDTVLIGFNLLPGAVSYQLNVSTSRGVQTLAPSVSSFGAMVAVDLTARGYTDEAAGAYSLILYVVAAGGSHASLSTTYTVDASVSVSPGSGLPGASATLTATGLLSGAYFDLSLGGVYLTTAQASLAGDLSAPITVPNLVSGTYLLDVFPTGSHVAVGVTSFTVTNDVLWSPDPSAFPGQLVSFAYTLPASLSKTPLASTQGYAAVLLNGTPYAVVPAAYSGFTVGSTISGSFTMFNGAPGSTYTLSVVPEYSVAATVATATSFPFTSAATPVPETFVYTAPAGFTVVSATASLTDTSAGTSAPTVTVTIPPLGATVTFSVSAANQASSTAYVITAVIALSSGVPTTFVDTARASSVTTLTLVSGSGALLLSLNESNIAEIATRTGQVVNISIGQLSAKVSQVYTKLNATYVSLTTNFGNMTAALNTIDLTLAGIAHNVIELNTSLGVFGVTLNEIGASVTGISNGVLALTTAVGDLNLSVAEVNATLASVNGNVVTVLTDLGSVQASLRTLSTTVSEVGVNVNDLLGASVMIQTALGNLSGKVTIISGDVATIQTSIGTLTTSVSSIQSSANSIQSSTNTTTTYLLIILVLVLVAVVLAVVALLRGRSGGSSPPRSWDSRPPTPPSSPPAG